jgi:hypothetical protein
MLRSYSASYLFGKEILQYRRIYYYFFLCTLFITCVFLLIQFRTNIVNISKPTSWHYLRTLWQDKIFWHCTGCILSRFRDPSSFTQSQPPILNLRYFIPPVVFTANFGLIGFNITQSLSLSAPKAMVFEVSSPPYPNLFLLSILSDLLNSSLCNV